MSEQFTQATAACAKAARGVPAAPIATSDTPAVSARRRHRTVRRLLQGVIRHPSLTKPYEGPFRPVDALQLPDARYVIGGGRTRE